jgi:hypothetical protein
MNVIEGESNKSGTLGGHFHFFEGAKRRTNRSGSMYIAPEINE